MTSWLHFRLQVDDITAVFRKAFTQLNSLNQSEGVFTRTTEEHKQRISEARLKSDAVNDSYAKIRATRLKNETDRWYTTKRAKAVMCIETGSIYRSAKDAELAIGCCDKHIQACCVGRRARHAGFTWKYDVPS